MKLSRPLLHLVRMADSVLFWPVLGFVVWGELFAPDSLPLIEGVNDKLLHLNAYFVLAVMAGAGFRERRPAIAAVIGLILMGGMLEIIQGLVGRDMSIYDELANAAGAIAGGILARGIIEPLRRRFGG
jgi:VanZ family protein